MPPKPSQIMEIPLVPTGPSTGIVPHITVSDGKAAIAFYKAAFGAEEQFCQMAEDGRRVYHCYLTFNHGELLLNDDFPEFRGGQAAKPPAGVTLHLQVEKADQVWERALDVGATIVVPLENQAWGLRYGVLRDPFGHQWSIANKLSSS